MIKRFLCLFVVLGAALVIPGCGPAEENVNIPVAKPGDGGPQPSKVSGAGGGGTEPAPAEGGATAKPSTE